MSASLDGKRVLVTGASRGIGQAIAEAFGEVNADVALFSRSRDRLEAVADGLDGETVVTAGDVRDTESVNECVDMVVDAFGGLDVVVNNAGIVTRGDLADTPDEDIDRVVDVNLRGVMRVARATLPALEESAGAMVNVSSIAADRGIEGLSSYSASKGGVSSLTRQLAVEYADRGVRVNAIVPGTIKTPANEEVRRTDPEWAETRRAQIPIGRLGEPADVADPAVFLASEQARYVTGQALPVDGGVMARA